MERVSFKDHFSRQASIYAKYRPQYPEAVFEYLASLVRHRDCAWDCATGNGQAAIGLASFFNRVIATDASSDQIKHAIPHDRVTYAVAAAERSAILPLSVDLIMVAQAIHWFDFNAFYTEVNRVLKPKGILAASGYDWTTIDPVVDAVIEKYRNDIIGAYWPPEVRLIKNELQTIPFPFEEISPPSFSMEKMWDMNEFIGYLGTWSATRRYIEDRDTHPIEEVRNELRSAWGNPSTKHRVRWSLSLRVGRKTLT